MSVDGRDNTPRILQALILANHGDGTLDVDLGDGEGPGLAYVPSAAQVGEYGTFIDVQGSLLQLSPPTPSGGGGTVGGLSFVPNGSFEVWGPDLGGWQEPGLWLGFWGPTTRSLYPNSDLAVVSDGLLAASIDTTILTAGGAQNLMFATAVRSPADDSGFALNLDVTCSAAGALWGVLVYWGRTDAEALPYGGGLSTVLRTMGAGPVGRSVFQAETYAPPGGYRYVRIALLAQQGGGGVVSFDDVSAVWLTPSASAVALPVTQDAKYSVATTLGTGWTAAPFSITVNNPHPTRIMRAVIDITAQGTIASNTEIGTRGSGATTFSEGVRNDRGYSGAVTNTTQLRGRHVRSFNPGNTVVTPGGFCATGTQNVNYWQLIVQPSHYLDPADRVRFHRESPARMPARFRR